MPTLDFSTSALQLTATLDGFVKVLIDDSPAAGSHFGSNGELAGCNSATITSVSLLVAQKAAPFKVFSNALNSIDECTYSYDNVSRIISEVSTLTAVPKYADYNVTLTLNFGTSSQLVSGLVSVLGDPITPTISAPIAQGSAPGTSLKLKLSPNSYEGLPVILTGRVAVDAVGTAGQPGYIPAVTEVPSSISKVIIFKDGVALPTEREYAHDGIYEISGLTADVEYSFAVQMKTTQGFVSDVSPSVTGTPVLTPSLAVAVVGSSGSNGDYNVLVAAESRAKLGVVGATDAQIKTDQLTQIDVYAYEHAADEINAHTATVLESAYRLIGTIKASVDADGISSTPATMLRIAGAYNGRHVRLMSKASNGHGQGASKHADAVRVMGAVSAPAVSYSLLGSNKYQMTVQPGAAVTGYTLIGYKVTSSAVGSFSGSDVLKSDTTTAYLRAIEKVTSSGVAGKADVVSSKVSSQVTFAMTANPLPSNFNIEARGIYEKTVELTQVLPLGSVVLGKDLRLATQDQKLVYDEKITDANVATERVFADAGALKSILVDADATSEAASKDKVPVLAVAAWTPAPTADFVSASGDKATFKISMAKYVSDNQVKYTILTAKQTNQALSNPVFVEQLTFNGNFLDAARVSANIEVARGERTLVQVRVSEYDGLDMIKQSDVTQIAAALTVAGQGAYSGLTIMSNAEQSAVAFPVTDVRSVLNFEATEATASTCLADIALERAALKDAKMVFNNLVESEWSKATKIYLLNADGTKTVQAATLRSVPFTVTGQDTRNFDVFALEDLEAMKSYSYEIHRHWVKGAETLYDAAPITVTIVPTIAVQNRAVKFFAADGQLNSAFESSGVDEVNGDDQMKAIKALGGVFNAVLMKNAAGKYDELDKSSSARFASVVTKKGIHFLASCAQYLNPNFGALYSIDNQYVKSVQTDDVQVYFGAVPATLSPVTVTSDKDGCLVSWPELAAGRSVDVYAHFDDVSFADKDLWEKLNSADLTANKFLIAHATLRSTLGLSFAQYFSGITFMVVQKDAAAGESLPAAIFHMPVGKTSFAATDFGVASGAKQLTIKYNKMGELNKEFMSEDFAGNSLIPATITYKDSNNIISTLKVADITSANGVVISGLDDAKTYIITIAIDGQKNDDLLLSGVHSPAAAPPAVSDLKVTIASVSSLNVEFTAASSMGDYATMMNRMYVTTVDNGVTKYVKYTDSVLTLQVARNSLTIGTPLTGLTAGAEYTVEIESTFNAFDGNSEQKVSAFASATPCAKPVMKDFRLNAKNKTATMIVDLQGAKLNTLLLLTNTGSVLNIALANAAVAQSVAISKRSNLALNISLPEGVTGAVGIIANSQGAALNGAPTNAQGFATTNDQTGLYDAVTAWTNL
jgi:hypothetical protein